MAITLNVYIVMNKSEGKWPKTGGGNNNKAIKIGDIWDCPARFPFLVDLPESLSSIHLKKNTIDVNHLSS